MTEPANLEPPPSSRAAPMSGRPSLTVGDGALFVIGVVVGTGIFKTPSLVAAETQSASMAMVAWLVGALASLVGALCYAELATTYPHVGGDFHYIGRAFGAAPAGLFAWARLLVLQSGSIAMQAFVVGDYASELCDLGPRSAAIYASVVVAAVTMGNAAGLRQGRGIQRVLTGALLVGLLAVIAAGALAPAAPPQPLPSTGSGSGGGLHGMGMALIFVLLTYGGWNEAVYLSAEVGPGDAALARARAGRRAILRVLVLALSATAVLYLAVNLVYFRALGLTSVASSHAVGATLMRHALGERGADALSVLVVIAALSTINATIFTGARTTFALGRSVRPLRFLGRWEAAAGSPRRALLTQGAISLVLVLLGALSRDGFRAMVEYTAPVFWLFLLLGVASLPVLRRKDPNLFRPFRVPLYPATPILFALVALAMLYSSVAYAGWGALIGVGTVVLGIPLFVGPRPPGVPHPGEEEPLEEAAQ